MKRVEIKALFAEPERYTAEPVTVCGWVRTLRSSKALGFIELNDGSYFSNLQVVFEENKLANYDEISRQNVGAALIVTGRLLLTPEAKQPFEIHAEKITVEGASTPDYPLQKKRHSMEFLRTIQHLRPRTNTFSAAFRVRSVAAQGIHKFFTERGFVYAHTPLITGSDCEGAGEMFRVTTIDPADPASDRGRQGRLQPGFLRQSHQSHRLRSARGRVYGYGLWQDLHLRPHLPRGKILHRPPCRRVLDDRTGDRLCRPGGQYGAGGGHDKICACAM